MKTPNSQTLLDGDIVVIRDFSLVLEGGDGSGSDDSDTETQSDPAGVDSIPGDQGENKDTTDGSTGDVNHAADPKGTDAGSDAG